MFCGDMKVPAGITQTERDPRRRIASLMRTLPELAPIVVSSQGCVGRALAICVPGFANKPLTANGWLD